MNTVFIYIPNDDFSDKVKLLIAKSVYLYLLENFSIRLLVPDDFISTIDSYTRLYESKISLNTDIQYIDYSSNFKENFYTLFDDIEKLFLSRKLKSGDLLITYIDNTNESLTLDVLNSYSKNLKELIFLNLFLEDSYSYNFDQLYSKNCLFDDNTINYINGDITEINNPNCLLVNGVNNQNVMGAGVAKAFSEKWPLVKHQYHGAYIMGSPKLGDIQCIEVEKSEDGKKIVANLWSQEYFGRDGKAYASLDAIAQGFESIIDFSLKSNINDIFIPKIGCGLGGLNWDNQVKPMLIKMFMMKDIKLHVVCQ